MLLSKKSAGLLLLALVLLFSEGCSKKMPCPDASQAGVKPPKAKKKKTAKVKKLNPDEDPDNMEMATASIEEPTDEKATQRAAITGKKNKYNKNGLLQKKKYKRLRSSPHKKQSRRKGGGSGKKMKSKTPKSRPNVGPLDDE